LKIIALNPFLTSLHFILSVSYLCKMESPRNVDPGSYLIEDFNYALPNERIATFPLKERDQSQLLVLKNGHITDARYYQIDQFLNPDSLLIANTTRVVRARLHFKTMAGATIEIFCLEPEDKKIEVNQAMQKTESTRWRCLVGELRKWKEEIIYLAIPDEKGHVILSAKRIVKEGDSLIIEFKWQPTHLTLAEILEKSGKVPLPPYIKREENDEDKNTYQTIYAQYDGSVAAPTAGLHFTDTIFNNLKKKNVDISYLTLHIGAGTFKPVSSEMVADHKMHSEQILIEKEFIQKLLLYIDKEIIAVGTTSLRTLESMYWLGLKIHQGLFNPHTEISVGQWDPYNLVATITPREALEEIIKFLDKNDQQVLLTRTQLLIVPGYEWKIVNILATNFHQPKSTLIMLVAAFIGEDWRKIYNHALENNYRFLSYGDGSLLFRKSY
jgi:S-adenosylmethionine:tRNA ribosyltransferase-isomerase